MSISCTAGSDVDAKAQVSVENNEVRKSAVPLQSGHAYINFAETGCGAGCEVNPA
jgi:hypothetical protein